MKVFSPRSEESESCLHQAPNLGNLHQEDQPAPRVSGLEGRHAGELETLGKVHIKYHILLDPARKQSYERSLGLIHLLILESLLKRQETTGIPHRGINAGGCRFWKLALQRRY